MYAPAYAGFGTPAYLGNYGEDSAYEESDYESDAEEDGWEDELEEPEPVPGPLAMFFQRRARARRQRRRVIRGHRPWRSRRSRVSRRRARRQRRRSRLFGSPYAGPFDTATDALPALPAQVTTPVLYGTAALGAGLYYKARKKSHRQMGAVLSLVSAAYLAKQHFSDAATAGFGAPFLNPYARAFAGPEQAGGYLGPESAGAYAGYGSTAALERRIRSLKRRKLSAAGRRQLMGLQRKLAQTKARRTRSTSRFPKFSKSSRSGKILTSGSRKAFPGFSRTRKPAAVIRKTRKLPAGILSSQTPAASKARIMAQIGTKRTLDLKPPTPGYTGSAKRRLVGSRGLRQVWFWRGRPVSRLAYLAAQRRAAQTGSAPRAGAIRKGSHPVRPNAPGMARSQITAFTTSTADADTSTDEDLLDEDYDEGGMSPILIGGLVLAGLGGFFLLRKRGKKGKKGKRKNPSRRRNTRGW